MDFCPAGRLSLNYQFQMSLLNPAYVGSEGQHSFALTSRNQWAQIGG